MAYETNAIGLDLSHWDEKVDWAQLKGNLDFVTLKAGGSDAGLYEDAQFAGRVQAAYDQDILTGAYWFVGPRYWLEKQQTMTGIDNLTDEQHPLLQQMLKTLKNKAICWLAFDVEDNSLLSSVGQVTDVWIKFYVADLVERIRRQQSKGNLRAFKMGVYSRRSFIDDPAKPQTALSTYLGVQPDLFVWTANWVNGTGATLAMSEVYKLRPASAHIPYSFGYCPTRPQTWQMWQWSGDAGRVYRSPAVTNAAGSPRGLDINLFNGTVEQLKAWTGITAPAPNPQPDPGDESDEPDTNLSAVLAATERIELEQLAQAAELDKVLAHLEKMQWLQR
jgi:hypothetical protein